MACHLVTKGMYAPQTNRMDLSVAESVNYVAPAQKPSSVSGQTAGDGSSCGSSSVSGEAGSSFG